MNDEFFGYIQDRIVNGLGFIQAEDEQRLRQQLIRLQQTTVLDRNDNIDLQYYQHYGYNYNTYTTLRSTPSANENVILDMWHEAINHKYCADFLTSVLDKVYECGGTISMMFKVDEDGGLNHIVDIAMIKIKKRLLKADNGAFLLPISIMAQSYGRYTLECAIYYRKEEDILVDSYIASVDWARDVENEDITTTNLSGKRFLDIGPYTKEEIISKIFDKMYDYVNKTRLDIVVEHRDIANKSPIEVINMICNIAADKIYQFRRKELTVKDIVLPMEIIKTSFPGEYSIEYCVICDIYRKRW